MFSINACVIKSRLPLKSNNYIYMKSPRVKPHLMQKTLEKFVNRQFGGFRFRSAAADIDISQLADYMHDVNS